MCRLKSSPHPMKNQGRHCRQPLCSCLERSIERERERKSSIIVPFVPLSKRAFCVVAHFCCQIVGDSQWWALTFTTHWSDECMLSFHQQSKAVWRLIISVTPCVPVHMSSPHLVISECRNNVCWCCSLLTDFSFVLVGLLDLDFNHCYVSWCQL